MDERDADFSKLEGDLEAEVTGGSSSPEETRREGEIERLRQELEEYKDKYLRALADQENARKRALKERSELLKYQGERIFLDLLGVLDNFELALQHSESNPEQLKAGLELIYKMFVELLGRWEVRGESAIGKEFDPVCHSAISKVPSADHKPGSVIGELKKIYFYKDKLLRPGEVVVAVEQQAELSASTARGEEESLSEGSKKD